MAIALWNGANKMMLSQQKLMFLVLLVVLSSSVLSCKRWSDSETPARPDPLVCAVSPGEHPSLDAAIRGFGEALRAAGIRVRDGQLSVRSAGGDPAAVGELLDATVRDGCDLVFVVATSAAQAARVRVAAQGVPVVYTAVSDPVGADVVDSMAGSSDPITGVSDRFPVDLQVGLFVALSGHVATYCALYNPAEQNSRFLVEATEQQFRHLGVTVRRFAIDDPSFMSESVEAAIRDCDALIVNGDNSLTENLELVLAAAQQAGKPVYVGDPDSVRRGAIATVGPDYAALGRQAGALGARVLAGEAAGSIASEHPAAFRYYVNVVAAARIGLNVPPQVWQLVPVWEGF